MGLSYGNALVEWLRPIQESILAAAIQSAHLRRDARTHHPHGTIQIITQRARPPADVIDSAAEDTLTANARDGARLAQIVGIPIRDVVPHDVVQTFRNENVAKIETLLQSQVDEVSTLLEQAENEGWHVTQLADAIQARFSVTESYASLLARDQVLKLNGQITERRQVASGVTSYVWTTAGDERVREDHAVLEGTEQSWSSPPIQDERTGETGHPGFGYQCRCIAFPIVDFGSDD